MSFLIGTTLTLETTASQAFGAGELRSIGVSLQRAWLANAALCCAITVLWCSAGAAFRALRQDPDLARLAGAYARACVPHAWLVGAQYPLQKVLQAQEVMLPFGAIGVVMLTFHVLVTRAAVRSRGYLGAAGALCATDALSLVLTAGVYVWRERGPQEGRTWPGISADALRGWPAFLKLAAPGVLMLVIEWSTFETVTLLSGLLPGAATGGPTAASAIAFNTIMLAFSLPLGFANAGSARVGAALGGNDAPAARRAAVVTFAAATGMQALLASMLGGLGGARYARLYTGSGPGSSEALAAFRKVLPALTVLVVGDGMQCALSGIVRGAGAQAIAARFNLLAYYLIGLPFGITLAFGAKVGLIGLWSGLAVATNLQAALLAAFLYRSACPPKWLIRGPFA
jgi:MATE family multidrug resistance protein